MSAWSSPEDDRRGRTRRIRLAVPASFLPSQLRRVYYTGNVEKKTNLDEYLADLGISEGGEVEAEPAATLPAAEGVLPGQSPEQVVRAFLEGLLRRIKPSLQLSVHTRGDTIAAEIEGSGAASLIGKEGRTLAAIELLAYTRLMRDCARTELRVQVDAAGYRRRHEEQLAELAQRSAVQAMKSGEAVHLAPQPPGDRRIIHLVLKESPGVSTESEGEGENRHVVIHPK